MQNDPGLAKKLPGEYSVAIADDQNIDDDTKKRYFSSASENWNIPTSMGSDPNVRLNTPDPVFSSKLAARGTEHYGEKIPEDKIRKEQDKKELSSSDKWRIGAMAVMGAAGIAVIGAGIATSKDKKPEIATISTANEANRANTQAARAMAEGGAWTNDEARKFQIDNEVIPSKVSAKEDYAIALNRAKYEYDRAKELGPDGLSGRYRDSFTDTFGYSPEEISTRETNQESWIGYGTLRDVREDAISEVGSGAKLDSYVLSRRGIKKPTQNEDLPLTAEEDYVLNKNATEEELTERFNIRKDELRRNERAEYKKNPSNKILEGLDRDWERKYVTTGQAEVSDYVADLNREHREQGEDLSSEFARPILGNSMGTRESMDDIKYASDQRNRIEDQYHPANLTQGSAATSGGEIPDDIAAKAEAELRQYDPVIDEMGNVIASSDEVMKEESGGRAKDVLDTVKSEGQGRLSSEQAAEQKRLWEDLPKRPFTLSYHKKNGGTEDNFNEAKDLWAELQAKGDNSKKQYILDMNDQGVSQYTIVIDKIASDYGVSNPREAFTTKGEYDKKGFASVFKQYKEAVNKAISLGERVLPDFAAYEVAGETTLKDGQTVERYTYESERSASGGRVQASSSYEYPSGMSQLPFSELKKRAQIEVAKFARGNNTQIVEISAVNYSEARDDIGAIIIDVNGRPRFVHLSKKGGMIYD
jgi:hypothetical protein